MIKKWALRQKSWQYVKKHKFLFYLKTKKMIIFWSKTFLSKKSKLMPNFGLKIECFFHRAEIGQRVYKKGLDTDLSQLEPFWDPFARAIAKHGLIWEIRSDQISGIAFFSAVSKISATGKTIELIDASLPQMLTARRNQLNPNHGNNEAPIATQRAFRRPVIYGGRGKTQCTTPWP